MPHCFTYLTNCYCISITQVLFLLHVVRHVAKHLAKERSLGKVNRFLINMRGTKAFISHSSIDVVETRCYRPSVLVTVYKSSNRIGHANSRAIDLLVRGGRA